MKVCAILTDGFETVECFAVVDILKRAGIEVDTISITGKKEVVSAHGITVVADYLFGSYEFDKSEVIFLPGGPGTKNYFDRKVLMNLLTEYNDNGNRIAAICAAPSVLGKLGFLKGKKATCFPGYEDTLEGAICLGSKVKTVTDGNITTSRGMGTSIDLGLELVRILVSDKAAKDLAKNIQYEG